MRVTSRGFIVFAVKGERYGLPLQVVAEVREPSRPVPVPRAPEFLCGAMNSHGRLVAILDLASLLGCRKTTPPGTFLVLDHSTANLALWVDGVEGFATEEGEGGADPPDNDFITRVVQSDRGAFKMLALDNVLKKMEEVFKQ
ncbi:MAG: chemotaxis protein CheW [Geobacter sp.]|nr:MAG: chemotaxis protein CheW [Geobacter sp.]